MREAFEREHLTRFGFIDPAKGARHRSGERRGLRRRRATRASPNTLCRRAEPPRAAARASSPPANGARRASSFASTRARPQPRGPRAHHRAEPDHRRRRGLARADHRARIIVLLTRTAPREKRTRRRHARRSGAAGSVQQPLHVHRRADGRDAAEHGRVREHQGAARFLLRDLRRRARTSSPTRRTCRCIWARWTARSRPSRARTRAHQARRRLRHQRALQRRHAPARHHRLHAGVRRRQARASCSGRRARASRRYRRHCARLHVAARHDTSRRKASTSTISCSCRAAASARPRRSRC